MIWHREAISKAGQKALWAQSKDEAHDDVPRSYFTLKLKNLYFIAQGLQSSISVKIKSYLFIYL